MLRLTFVTFSYRFLKTYSLQAKMEKLPALLHSAHLLNSRQGIKKVMLSYY